MVSLVSPATPISPLGLVFIASSILLVVVAVYVNRPSSLKKSARKFPPGPKPLPVIGNLHQVPVLRPYPRFRQWASEFGPVFLLRFGAQPVVVLNTAKAADALLNQRAQKYSSRPPPHVAHDIMSDGQRMVFLPYGPDWKATKRAVLGTLGPGPSKTLRTMQELESRTLIWDLMKHGEASLDPVLCTKDAVYASAIPEKHWFGPIRRYTTSVVMFATYGYRIDRVLNRPQVTKIYDVLANFAHVGQPGNYLADTFKIFRSLPDLLAQWRVHARKMHEWEMELWGGLLDSAKRTFNQGIANNSFVNIHLRERVEAGHAVDVFGKGITRDGFLTDKLLAYTAGTLLEAGSDTTASTMQSFILFMLSHPAALERARAEIDAAVGADETNIGRLPSFEDEGKCPWLAACIIETLRRRPPTIMGIPHLADEDDEYEGMYIPKGATVIGNVWAINHDATVYPNPMAWLPERHLSRPLDKDGKVRWGAGPLEQDRVHYVFGWGRRFCPGYHLAHASFFVVLSRLIWALDLEAPLHPATGKTQLPDIYDDEATFTTGFVSVPRIFPVSFKPRSKQHEVVVQSAFDEAQNEWESLGLDKDDR